MKHAQMTTNWLIWMLRVVFLVVVIFSISTVIVRYAQAFIDVSHVQANIITYKLLLDPSLVVVDPVTQRLSPFILQKTLPENIDTHFVYPEDVVAARISVQDKEVFYRKQTYQRRASLQTTIFGKEFFHITTTYPVLFQNQPTTLSVDVYVRT